MSQRMNGKFSIFCIHLYDTGYHFRFSLKDDLDRHIVTIKMSPEHLALALTSETNLPCTFELSRLKVDTDDQTEWSN